MFVLEPSLVKLSASPDDVLTLLTSLNRPMVALEDHPMDEGDATIWSVRRESDMISTYVHLCLTNKKIGVFYRYEVDPYPDDLRGMVEGEALGFAESLGFIMDNTHYAELDAEERKQHLARGPFAWPGGEAAGEAPSPEEGSTGPSAEAPTDFGEADQGVILAPEEADARGYLSDEEVDGAVRALTGGDETGTEDPGAGAIDEEFERAVEEFIAGGAGVDQEEPRPQHAPAPAAKEGGFAPSPLSRFRRRKDGSDIYQIRGLEQAAGNRDAAAGGASSAVAEPPPHGPDAAAEVRPPEAGTENLSDDVVRGDPETRRRRARARFLASF